MSRYVKGKYKAVSNEKSFNNLIDLKNSIQMIAGFEQNTMIVDEEDIEYCENQINKLKNTLDCWFENKLENLTYLGDTE